ncbi:MAG: hypothetical protein N2558_01670 [Patescibacteria group bacterium]|nr:hypothetical protein [Patescibacteria group bacterium]
MLGGVVYSILLYAIWRNENFDAELIREKVLFLKSHEIIPGAHRGSHKDLVNGKCDCGFCDGIVNVLRKALVEENEIRKRLAGVYMKNKDKFVGTDFNRAIDIAYEKLKMYPLDRIFITGEQIVSLVE